MDRKNQKGRKENKRKIKKKENKEKRKGIKEEKTNTCHRSIKEKGHLILKCLSNYVMEKPPPEFVKNNNPYSHQGGSQNILLIDLMKFLPKSDISF